MRLEEVTRSGELDALRPAWEALWSRCPAATPFQHPAWLLAWWHAFGNETPWTLALYQGARLVALAPLFSWNEPIRDARLERPSVRLSWIGAGLTDALDLLVDPAVRSSAVAARVLEHIIRHSGRFDVCELEGLRADSPLVRLHSDSAGGLAMADRNAHLEPSAGSWFHLEQEGVSAVLTLPPTLEAFWQARPRHHRNFRQSWRRLERAGGLEVVEAAEETLEELLEALFRLHQARWEARGEAGVLDDSQVRAMHREAAAGLLEAGCLRLIGLRHRGALAAVHYGFSHRRRYAYYLGGFDPALGYYSPGSLLVGLALERAIREGCLEFDFLRGSERYKAGWGAAETPVLRLRGGTDTPGRNLEVYEWPPLSSTCIR